MRRIFAVASGAFVLLTSLAWSQQQGDVAITSIAEVEVMQKNAQGKTEKKRVEASKTRVAPGDVVIFTTRYANQGKQPATGVVITNPVPQHMAYLDKSAEGKGTRIAFSIDGGKTYDLPDKLRIMDRDGVARPALPEEYTHVRWTITDPVPSGTSGSVTFRARIR